MDKGREREGERENEGAGSGPSAGRPAGVEMRLTVLGRGLGSHRSEACYKSSAEKRRSDSDLSKGGAILKAGAACS